jgi:hypothetical protein
MPRGRQFGFIFKAAIDNQNAIPQVIAHELGHGCFTLKHTFDKDYGNTAKETQGATDNLMDYSANASHLAKWQWDIIQNPAVFAGLTDKDEEGMWTTDGHYYTVQLVALILGIEPNQAFEIGKSAEEPDTHIVSNYNMEEKDTWMQAKLQQQLHALTGGYHGVELAVTSYALIKTQPNNLWLLHRFGDLFSHTKIKNDKNGWTTSVNVIDYINGLDRYIDNKFLFNSDLSAEPTPYGIQNLQQLGVKSIITESGKVKTILSREQVVSDFIEFLLSGIQNSNYLGIRLESYNNDILNFLPNAIQNNNIMYGTEQVSDFTLGHMWRNIFADYGSGYSPDNIVERTQLYLLYVNQLSQLLAIKYNKQINDNIQQTFSFIIDYVKYSTIDRLDGILAFEIEKYKHPNSKEIIFYIPVKYIIKDNLTRQGYIYNKTQNFSEQADEIKEDTYKYFDKSGEFKRYFIEDKLINNNGVQYLRFKLTKK